MAIEPSAPTGTFMKKFTFATTLLALSFPRIDSAAAKPAAANKKKATGKKAKKKRCPSNMVSVWGGFCIDRYEAYVNEIIGKGKLKRHSPFKPLDKKKKFMMELEVQIGRGFHPGDDNKKPDQPIGVIAIDSIFSPVTRVKYAVENARVGQRTDYDKLVLDVWTDGRITPDDALTQASAILQHHLE